MSEENDTLAQRFVDNFIRAPHLPAIGYWHDDDDSELIHPQGLVDPDWEQQRRADIVNYLRTGRRWVEWMGYSYCRFGCSQDNGDADLTDGTWIWPQGLAHYVEVHLIRLPDEFVRHAAAHDFMIPRHTDPNPFYAADLRLWAEWYRQTTKFTNPEPHCFSCTRPPRQSFPAGKPCPEIAAAVAEVMRVAPKSRSRINKAMRRILTALRG